MNKAITGAIRIVAATALFSVVHSAMATRRAKRIAASAVGEPARDGVYRVFYIGQSLVTFAALAAYIRRQPGVDLYRVSGAPAALLRTLQAAGLVYATAAASEVGLLKITGLESFTAWLRGDDVPPTPEAQGPALAHDGRMKAAGPFRLSRHPLNFSPVVLCWFNPRMTSNWAAFNIAAAIYLVLGSAHEEARLRSAYGNAYRAYQEDGPAFFLPVGKRGRAELGWQWN